MKITTNQPYGSWELQILIENAGITSIYEINGEDEARQLISEVEQLLFDLESYKQSFDSKD